MNGNDEVAGNVGEVTPESITWGLTRPSDHDGRWYGWDTNVLYYTDGQTFVVPSSGLRGDVNDDGEVGVADATALIDALLSGNLDVINRINADANLDGDISVSDITAIIDYLLSGTWPN